MKFTGLSINIGQKRDELIAAAMESPALNMSPIPDEQNLWAMKNLATGKELFLSFSKDGKIIEICEERKEKWKTA